jgi:membrane-bound lytic murein transglycosylase B
VAAQALDGDALATAVRFEQPDAFDYWMGLHNFYVITRYNRSNMYAMAVFQLSQRIAMGARE